MAKIKILLFEVFGSKDESLIIYEYIKIVVQNILCMCR